MSPKARHEDLKLDKVSQFVCLALDMRKHIQQIFIKTPKKEQIMVRVGPASRSRSIAMALEAHLQQAVLLKKVVHAMKDSCKDVNFDCSEKGLQVQSMDSSHVALVSLLLRESAFADYKCERPLSLGMNVESLAKILKMCGPTDSLKVRWQGGADTVGFQCESGSDDRIADFDLKLMQIESEHMEIPEQHYKVTAKLPSAVFQKFCRDLKEFGETMQVKASKEGITFSVQGDAGGGNVMLKPREAERPEDRVALTECTVFVHSLFRNEAWEG